jgi:tight adherence protein B
MKSVDLAVLKWTGAVLLVCGVLLSTAIVVGAREGLPHRLWERYVVFLEGKLRRMYIWTDGHRIAAAQAGAILICLALRVLFALPGWYLLAAASAIVPPWWIERMRRKRVIALEEQLDGFLLALSNALKATPSVGDAFHSLVVVLAQPMRQEIATAIKEMRVGATLDQALVLMASRVDSRPLDSALSAILIGRQVGGNLPKILDSTASSLREMARLEGVVRTKTAEGKTQLWVLAFFPLVLILGINAINPGNFDPLTESLAGYALVGLAVLLWGGSLVAARKILAVDI